MSSGRRRTELRPLQQGDLDYLCGVYAIVNALRLAVGRGRGLDSGAWDQLFRQLVLRLDQNGLMHEAMTWGLGVRRVWRLSKMVAAYLDRSHGVAVRVSRPLKGLHDLDGPGVFGWLEMNAGQPATAVVVGIDGVWDQQHWTVVRSAAAQVLSLYDSCATRGIRVVSGGLPPWPDHRSSSLKREPNMAGTAPHPA